ncbi:MAG: ABC transporter substrate-binding protein [Parvularculales bacterium]
MNSKILGFIVLTVAVVIIGFVLYDGEGEDNRGITVVSWGGAYKKSQEEAYHKPWVAMTGRGINSVDYNGGLAEIKAQVESGNVTWDAVDLETSDAQRGCDEGLFEEIDFSKQSPAPDGTPAVKDFLPGSLIPCAVPSIVWSTIYAYDKNKFLGNAPTTIEDFFNTTKFPGKRGMRKIPKTTLEIALMGDGVAPEDVYDMLSTKVGIDRAFAKLNSIKDDILWWEAGAQPPQMLADGEVSMSVAFNGRIFNAAIKEGKPFEIVWDGQIFDIDLWAIPKGSRNKDLALDFITFASDTQRLADQAQYISYGPARLSSIPLVGKDKETGVDMAPHLPTAPQNLKKSLQSNSEWWADHQDEMNERFNAWLVQAGS